VGYIQRVRLLAALQKISTKEFNQALVKWVWGSSGGGNSSPLTSLYKSKPELFPKPTAGTKPLYRVVAIWEEVFDDLMAGKPLKNKEIFESWTSSKQAAEAHKKYLMERDNWLVATFYKKPKKILLYVPDYVKDIDYKEFPIEFNFSAEQEYIVFSEPLTLKDLWLVVDEDKQCWYKKSVQKITSPQRD